MAVRKAEELMQIPLTNTYGDPIGHVEIDDKVVEEVIETTPQLWLGYRVRNDEVEKFILQIEGGRR